MSSRETAPVRQMRDKYYDGIRAIAIMAVISVHWLGPYLPGFKGGYVGVDVFFVLSGFIITTVLWRRAPRPGLREDYGNFLWGRLKRLYPALLGLLIVGTAVVGCLGHPVDLAEAIHSAVIAVVQATSIFRGLQLDHVEPFAHTWSLSVEWVFYLLWPIILFAAKRRGVDPLRLAGLAGIASFLLFVVTLPASPQWFYYGLTSRSAQLMAGASIALWAISGRFRPTLRAAPVSVLSVLALAVIALWAVFGPQEMALQYRLIGYPLVTVSAMYLCALPVLGQSPLVSILSWNPLARLGLVSYSLYLWHLLAIQVLVQESFGLPMWALAGIGILATAALTTTSYLVLERPFMVGRSSSLRVR